LSGEPSRLSASRWTPRRGVSAPAGLARDGAHAAPDRQRAPRVDSHRAWPGTPDEAELYRRYQRQLVRAVARIVHASDELVEDACQEA
jgi:hypothetical protein